MENSTDKPKTIDEKLAEANRQFDARLASEAKPGEVRVRPKPQKQVARPKAQKHRVGDFTGHYHPNETDYEIVDVPCHYVEHNVRDRKGFRINDVRYRGRVIVPQCTANTLSEMENKHRAMERAVFEDRGRQLNYGEIRG